MRLLRLAERAAAADRDAPPKGLPKCLCTDFSLCSVPLIFQVSSWFPLMNPLDFLKSRTWLSVGVFTVTQLPVGAGGNVEREMTALAEKHLF
jgi:hypothetical protein